MKAPNTKILGKQQNTSYACIDFSMALENRYCISCFFMKGRKPD